jgi:hypothetical protein
MGCRLYKFSKFTVNTSHMTPKTIKRLVALLLAVFLTSTALWAQADKSKRPSPPDSTSGQVGDATLTINYGSPSVRGRAIWGKLVPYDKVWRAGANEATLFETDKAIMVEGKSLPAGRYSLFAIPGEKEWQFIFNSQTGQWGINRSGEANRDPANDVLTVTVTPRSIPGLVERLQYEVTPRGFSLKWEHLEVPVAVQ